MRSHKYIKRTGSKGAYKYWYKLPDGRVVSGDSPEGAAAGHSHEKGKQEHLKRLIAGRIHGHHEMTHKQIAEHVGTEEKKVRWAQSNMAAAGRRATAAGRATGTAQHGHDFDEHHMKEAKHEDVTSAAYGTKTSSHPGEARDPHGRTAAEATSDRTRGAAARAARRKPAAPSRAETTAHDHNADMRAAGFRPHEGGGHYRHVTHGQHRIVRQPSTASRPGEKWNLEVTHAHLGNHDVDYPSAERAIEASKRIEERHTRDMAKRRSREDAEARAESNNEARAASERATEARDNRVAEVLRPSAPAANSEADKAAKIRELREKLAREHGVNLAAAPAAEAPAAPAQSPEQARQQAAKAAQRAQANAAPSSPAARAMHAASPDLAAADETITRMIAAQAAGQNPYFDRAVEIYQNVIGDVKPERKAVVNHIMQALNNMKGRGEAWNDENLVKEYKRLSGKNIRGTSGIGSDFEKATFMTLEEVMGNAPLNPEVERMKRGYAAKQFARLRPYLKDSFTASHPGAPPPMPTYGDIKSWTEHGGTKPSWAGTTRMALPKEVHDAAPKGSDGKPKHPPAWMPIHMAPIWNYIVKKSGDEGNPYQTVNPISQGRVNASKQAGYQEGIAINAMRKYIQMRGGAEQLIDIPAHKLSEVGLSHSDIFKAEDFDDSDAGIKKIIKHKIVDPCALHPFLVEAMKEKPIKKSFSLVVDEEARPVVFKKSFTVDLEKSEIIRKIKELKKAKATV